MASCVGDSPPGPRRAEFFLGRACKEKPFRTQRPLTGGRYGNQETNYNATIDQGKNDWQEDKEDDGSPFDEDPWKVIVIALRRGSR